MRLIFSIPTAASSTTLATSTNLYGSGSSYYVPGLTLDGCAFPLARSRSLIHGNLTMPKSLLGCGPNLSSG